MESSSSSAGRRLISPWKLYRVISGHLGCVTTVAFDPSNAWFCTGSDDRTIKIWDTASGRLKLTLTGHVGQVKSLSVDPRHPYIFSAGNDGHIKCWDMEHNMVIRSYYDGGGSRHRQTAVHSLSLHPTVDVLLTGGDSGDCTVWDIRSKTRIHSLLGHRGRICSILARARDPQVITGSGDKTIKFWDLRSGGGSITTLTHHKKSVRAMAREPTTTSSCFLSASADSLKSFGLPSGELLQSLPGTGMVNAVAVNVEGVVVTGGDEGSLCFREWKCGRVLQKVKVVPQPGSLADSESGLCDVSFDVTGTRLVTCGVDKTIKMWKQSTP